MERDINLTIESFFNSMEDTMEKDDFFEYIQDCWVAERRRQELWHARRQQPPFSFSTTLLLLFDIFSKNIIEIPKIILNNIKYVFIVINDNYTRFIFSQ